MYKNPNTEISYLEGNQNYTYIYYKDGKRVLSSYTLLRHEKKLTNFLRINRSYLVNPDMIDKYILQKKEPHIILKCGKKITIPKWKLKDFFSLQLVCSN